MRGVLHAQEGLFQRDIPGLLIEHAKNISVEGFQLKWSDTKAPFFTHGIEANNFNGLQVINFSGGPSPLSAASFRIFVHGGERFFTDNAEGINQKGIK